MLLFLEVMFSYDKDFISIHLVGVGIEAVYA